MARNWGPLNGTERLAHFDDGVVGCLLGSTGPQPTFFTALRWAATIKNYPCPGQARTFVDGLIEFGGKL